MNRCMFIEGIGRVHVIGPLKPEPLPPGKLRDHDGRFRSRAEAEAEAGPWVALADEGPWTLEQAMLAADIVTGQAKGKILWSVRFQEAA